ncbi:MAG: response regulator [Candidatus Omnitrophota bacterium]
MLKKILVIDDNEQDRKIIKRFLNKAGYKDVVLAETGEVGVEKAKFDNPELVISDTMLPGIDGFEVCRQIREAQAGIKIIMMTGAIDAVDAVKAKKMGADDYCVKTSDYAVLLEAVKKLIYE